MRRPQSPACPKGVCEGSVPRGRQSRRGPECGRARSLRPCWRQHSGSSGTFQTLRRPPPHAPHPPRLGAGHRPVGGSEDLVPATLSICFQSSSKRCLPKLGVRVPWQERGRPSAPRCKGRASGADRLAARSPGRGEQAARAGQRAVGLGAASARRPAHGDSPEARGRAPRPGGRPRAPRAALPAVVHLPRGIEGTPAPGGPRGESGGLGAQ